MKKVFFILILTFVSCFAASCNKQPTLKLGTYQTDDKLSWVVLSENNEFEFIKHATSSYIPRGTYLIKNGQLILTDANGETYIFDINRDKLVFQSGKMAEGMIDIGTVYKLSTTES